ncbi:M15 family metallopeptidase [Oerskovia enterophila]
MRRTSSSRSRVAVLAGGGLLLGALSGCVAGNPPPPSATSVAAPAPSGGSTAPTPTPSKRSPPAPQAPPEPATASPEPGAPVFSAAVGPVTPELAERMTPSSWREGCPVGLADLRYVTLTHRTFEGGVATGELVVHADVADGLVGVFHDLFDAGYPIRSMRLVDDFGGDDDASMAADNTSAFSCRPVAGTDRWSEHAYGRALDLNPVENPWVSGDAVEPPAGAEFASRPAVAGVIAPDDATVRAFLAAGWQWGGYWTGPVDYQHFSTNGT